MTRLFVGTYTQLEDHVNGQGEGIYSMLFDAATGSFVQMHVMQGIVNPSFLALNASGTRLYAVAEVTNAAGRLFAYAVDRTTGALTSLGSRSTQGAAPCYVHVHPRHALVANYLGGSVAVLPLDGHGGLRPASDLQRHYGSGPNPARQEAPHPHAIVLDPPQRYALVPDLGTDTVVSYPYDPAQGVLTNPQEAFRTRPGAGPRHLTFDRSGRIVYLINELDATVVACSYDEGICKEIQTVDALPRSVSGTPSGADIHLHPSGRFLYTSLRSIHSILRMRVDVFTGRLLGRAYAHGLGTTPRNFAIDPKGRFLVVANQDSGTLAAMLIDPDSGLLRPVGTPALVPSPACIAIGV